jgi:hypothetical protein
VIAVFLAVLALLAPAAGGASGGQGSITATESQGAEVCFPRALWSAYLEDDPCDLIERPREDGSGFLYLGTLGADAATCVIPNPYEERGRFVIHCHRVPNR